MDFCLRATDFPFGIEIFELCAKFCYSFKFEVNNSNVIPLFCASDNLRMEEDISDGNLKAHPSQFCFEKLERFNTSSPIL
jgi:hypothetical protein